MTRWRPRFVIAGDLDWLPIYPLGAWRESIGASAGGFLESGAGVLAGFVVRRDHLLSVPVRLDESEIPTLFAMLALAQSGRVITFYPDALEGASVAVHLYAPAAADDAQPEPDDRYPSAHTFPLTLRRVDGAPFDLDYWQGRTIQPTALPWRAAFTFGSGPTVLRMPLPVTRWRHVLAGEGGTRWTADGTVGAWRQSDRHRLALSLRFTAAEWPAVRAWIAWAHTGAPFGFTPDPETVAVASCYLDAPGAGEPVEPGPSAGYPIVRELAIVIRRADGEPFGLEYFGPAPVLGGGS